MLGLVRELLKLLVLALVRRQDIEDLLFFLDLLVCLALIKLQLLFEFVVLLIEITEEGLSGGFKRRFEIRHGVFHELNLVVSLLNESLVPFLEFLCLFECSLALFRLVLEGHAIFDSLDVVFKVGLYFDLALSLIF